MICIDSKQMIQLWVIHHQLIIITNMLTDYLVIIKFIIPSKKFNKVHNTNSFVSKNILRRKHTQHITIELNQLKLLIVMAIISTFMTLMN